MGFNGIKTGITSTAGACMAASFLIEWPLKGLIRKLKIKKALPRTHEIVIIVLGSKSIETRWYEVKMLA